MCIRDRSHTHSQCVLSSFLLICVSPSNVCASMQINLQSAHPLSGTSIIKEPPSCKRTRAGSTLLRTTCYTIRAEFCQYLSHLTAGTPSVPTFCQFRERNSGVIFSRSYLHRASTCPRLSAAFCANFPIWHCLTRKSCSLLSPSLFLHDYMLSLIHI